MFSLQILKTRDNKTTGIMLHSDTLPIALGTRVVEQETSYKDTLVTTTTTSYHITQNDKPLLVENHVREVLYKAVGKRYTNYNYNIYELNEVVINNGDLVQSLKETIEKYGEALTGNATPEYLQ